MSTTFEVFPTTLEGLTFGRVFQLAEKRAHEFLKSVGIALPLELCCILDQKSHVYAQANMPFYWPKETRALIYISGDDSPIDAMCFDLRDPETKEEQGWFLEELKDTPNFNPKYKEMLHKCSKLSHRWSFIRFAGCTPLINICYGFLAAAVADLSKGLIHSSDGAWDFSIFPAEPSDFYKTYFQPEMTSDKDQAYWSQNCIEAVRKKYL